jgi:hypothetical protein
MSIDNEEAGPLCSSLAAMQFVCDLIRRRVGFLLGRLVWIGDLGARRLPSGRFTSFLPLCFWGSALVVLG